MCKLFVLYNVRVGFRPSPNKLIWFSGAVLLFVVEWRQNRMIFVTIFNLVSDNCTFEERYRQANKFVF